MPLPVGTIIQQTYVSLYAAQRYMFTSTWRIFITGSVQNTTEDAQSIALFFSDTTFQANFVQQYRSCISNLARIRTVSAQAIHPTRHVRASISVDYPGLFTGASPTGNVAATITLRTQLAGRTQVANKHIGPMGTNAYSSGSLESTYVPILANFGAGMTTNKVVPAGVNTIELVPVIFHKKTGLHDVAVSHVVTDRVGTMRRRTLRVGE